MRASGSDVRSILTDSTLTDEDVEPFLLRADALVRDRLEGKSISEPVLREIEILVAAHFATIKAPELAEVKLPDVTRKHTGAWGRGLARTSYGQDAIDLDPTGTLRRMASSQEEGAGSGFVAVVGYE